MKKLLSVLLVVLLLGITSCGLPKSVKEKTEENTEQKDSEISIVINRKTNEMPTVVSRSENVEITVKNAVLLQVGDGENKIKYKMFPDEVVCPRNLFFYDDGYIGLTDAEGKKLIFFDKDGKIAKTVDVSLSAKAGLSDIIRYAAYKNGCAYVIYEDGAFYEFGQNGECTLISDGADGGYGYMVVYESETDGNLIVYNGPNAFIYGEGKFTEYKPHRYDPHTVKNGDEEQFVYTYINCGKKIDIIGSGPSEGYLPAGIIKNTMVTAAPSVSSDGRHMQIISENGEMICELLIPKCTGDVMPQESVYVHGDKIYVLSCRAEYVAIDEISIEIK